VLDSIPIASFMKDLGVLPGNSRTISELTLIIRLDSVSYHFSGIW
ncbi:23325_t:CDS:1, partial [Entrophospora sp. SA101]